MTKSNTAINMNYNNQTSFTTGANEQVLDANINQSSENTNYGIFSNNTAYEYNDTKTLNSVFGGSVSQVLKDNRYGVSLYGGVSASMYASDESDTAKKKDDKGYVSNSESQEGYSPNNYKDKQTPLTYFEVNGGGNFDLTDHTKIGAGVALINYNNGTTNNSLNASVGYSPNGNDYVGVYGNLGSVENDNYERKYSDLTLSFAKTVTPNSNINLSATYEIADFSNPKSKYYSASLEGNTKIKNDNEGKPLDNVTLDYSAEIEKAENYTEADFTGGINASVNKHLSVGLNGEVVAEKENSDFQVDKKMGFSLNGHL